MTDLKAQSLRPGYLVYCTCRVQGGVSYSHEDVGTDREGERVVKVFTTTKVVEDETERKAAEELRARCRSMIIKACWPSTFGLITPLEDRDGKGPNALREAIAEAQKEIVEHNLKSTSCRVLLTVIPARIESNDTAAMAGIAGEIQTMLEQMQRELSLGQPDAARKLANKMKDLGRMLDGDAEEKVAEAISTVRKAARKIVKEGADTALEAAAILRDMDMSAIDSARVSFIDLEQKCIEETALPVADIQRVAGIDIGEHKEPEPEAIEPEQPARVDLTDGALEPIRRAAAAPTIDLD